MCFTKNDLAERPLILFDKNNAITFKEKPELNVEKLQKIFNNCKNRILQSSRVTKYIKRNQYGEAYLKYNKNIANSLVTIARIIYTPDHLDYGLCHINDHLPKEIVQNLEKFYKIASFEDIERNILEAKDLLELLERIFVGKYNTITDLF